MAEKWTKTILRKLKKDDIWAVAFVTDEVAAVTSRIVGEPCYHVFAPTTPNPTSGFLLVVPRRKVRDTNLSVEEAMKLIISAGSVSPRGVEEGEQKGGLDMDSLFHDGGT